MSRVVLDLTVREIGLGGSGVGTDDEGRVVFVDRTVPGDQVRAEVTERRARWSRARVVELRRGGPGRVTPPCPRFSDCGGCAWQHVDAGHQAAALTRGIEEVLRRVGGAVVEVLALEPAGRRSGYRNRVTFTLRRAGGSVVAGFHRPHGPDLVDIERCPLAEPAIADAWRGLRAAWGPGAGLLPSGRELKLTLRAGSGGRVGLLIAGGAAPREPGRSAMATVRRNAVTLLGRADGLASVWWRAGGGGRHHLAGASTLPDTWFGIPLALRPEAFVQTNRAAAVAIESHLDAELGSARGSRIADLYAGVGLRAIRWALSGADVVAVESGADAVETGREAAERAGAAVTFVHARVEDAIAGIGARDAIVVNPPRAGLGAGAAELLTRVQADRLAYVSCDPATLARDVGRLSAAWRPRFAKPFDAFPQTGHVETVLWLDRRGGSEG